MPDNRQKRYETKRAKKASRLNIWMDNELLERIDARRGGQSRTEWINSRLAELLDRADAPVAARPARTKPSADPKPEQPATPVRWSGLKEKR